MISMYYKAYLGVWEVIRLGSIQAPDSQKEIRIPCLPKPLHDAAVIVYDWQYHVVYLEYIPKMEDDIISIPFIRCPLTQTEHISLTK